MTDPDALITLNDISEWLKRAPDIQYTRARHHLAFAERALRMFKHLIWSKVE